MRQSLGEPTNLRFRVLNPLGGGGFGAVHLALDTRSGQHVALKQLADMSADGLARFKQEFRVLTDLHHDNLVGIKEMIEDDGRWFIVMELVPGTDLLSYVREPADNENRPYDEVRLRRALRGVAHGLAAMHAHGILHRDLKPSNVRVTPEGRAVLLDFGLATSTDPHAQSVHTSAFGTACYMAPEQATRANLGPAADWYAFGVCLFEALTGRPPFDGETPFQVVMQKQRGEAPRASGLVPGVPPDLDRLCARLLERDPTQRADEREVLAALDDADAGAQLARSLPPPLSFAGREPELLQLERAFARTQDGVLKLVLVEGESGVGKSELVAEFVRRKRAQAPRLLVLSGRCYENEQVSYKALDGCIDELSRFLLSLPAPGCAALLPPRAALLAQLFPVLRKVEAIAQSPLGELSADPSARRLEAFGALAALLDKLGEERSLVLVIDDLQWADAESFRLLLALIEAPQPPAMLIVATIRPPEELEAEAIAGLALLDRKQRLDRVPVLGLPLRDAEALALAALGPRVPAGVPRMVAEESGGHPLFLGELLRYATSGALTTRGALTLEEALRARVEQLAPEARALLELAALAGRPHGSHLYARALEVESVEEPARSLLASKLLRPRKAQELDCYHDRIRRTAVALIVPSRLPALHRQLALALSSDPLGDDVESARHWDLGGAPERAIEAYERAAEVALDTLAFMRAAELCARALELLGDDRDLRAQRLLVKRADALACAGLSAAAAPLYERAVGQAHGQRRYELRARHAQQLILCGELAAGMAAMRALLSELGVRIPSSDLVMMLQIGWSRVRLWLSRGHFEARPARHGEERLVFTAEVLKIFLNAIGPLHPLVVIHQTLFALRYASKIPLIENVLQLHAGLGWLRALGGEYRAAEAMFEKARALAPRVAQQVALANAAYVEGSAYIMACDHRHAARCLESAQRIVQTRCADQHWLRRNIRYHLGTTWYTLGDHGRIARESTQWIAEAEERNDSISVALLVGLGYGFLRHLMQDAPDEVPRELARHLPRVPPEPYSFVHLGALIATVTALLYKGGPEAHRWLEARAREHKRPLLLRSPIGRELLAVYGALSALHALHDAAPARQAALRAEVQKEIRLLRRASGPIMRAQARTLQVQLHLVEGRRDAALAEARAAVAAASQPPDYAAHVARFLLAIVETGTLDDPRCVETLGFFRGQGWRDPLGALRIQLPVLRGVLQAREAKEHAEPLLLGRYEVLGTLGSGGFGAVVEARDVASGETLALKELVSPHPRSLERFKQEFRALQNLHHTNLLRLHALVEHQGTWYIVMERVAGEPLLAYTRPEGMLDEARVRRAFAGIVEALSALHEAGLVHRDLKPDNVRVTADGRAVVLDFGLIGRIDDASDEGAVGSLEHSAPEQLDGAPPSPTADVYALGSCLVHVLTGAAPVAHAHATSAEEPRGASDLSVLARRLRARSPADRPTLSEVRAWLATGASQEPTAHLSRGSSADAPGAAAFVGSETVGRDAASPPLAGREEELSRIDDAFEDRRERGVTLVLVEGESGVGKTAVISEFARRLEARSPKALVLRSHCYENELVAFKALDAAVDQLARALRALTPAACEALLPKRAALLGQLFPVLNGVPSIAGLPKKGLPADASAQRRAALDCLIELLARVSRSREVVIAIDDLQWADSDSFQVLEALLACGASLPLLIVCTMRPEAEVPESVRRALSPLRTSPTARRIALAGLSDHAAARLAGQLCGTPLPPEQLARVLHEAKGHPLFLRELIARERAGTAWSEALTLDQVLRARIESFDTATRALLSLVALAGKPCGTHVHARALGLPELPRGALVTLLGQGMLRRSGPSELTIDHHRVAQAARALLSADEVRTLSRSLAEALDAAPEADPSERARLWDEAGDRERALAAHEAAGDRALEMLHFTRSALHFARALALRGPMRDAHQRSLQTRRGDALARAGQSAEAARVYAEAAESAEGALRIQLRIRAAEQAMLGAEAEAGLAAARALLAELGIVVPAEQASAVARTAFRRLLLRLSRRDLARPRSALSARTRMRLDAAWSLALPLSWLDPLGGALLTTHHLRAALASGEPTHTARALAAEAFALAARDPGDRKIDALLAHARALAEPLGDPALEAEVSYREGSVAILRWDYARAEERLEGALTSVTERCPDQPWLTTNVRTALGMVWHNRLEHARLKSAHESWLAEARARGDLFAITSLYGLGYGFIHRLMDDDPDAIRAQVEENRARWPARPFSFLHFGDLLATLHERLYRGGDEALAWYDGALPALSRIVILRIGTFGVLFRALGGAALLAAWSHGPRAGDPALLARLRPLIDDLAGTRNALAGHLAPLLSVQLDIAEGRRERAREISRQVEEAASARGFTLHAHRARYLGALLDDSEIGRGRRDTLRALYASHGWKRPERAFAIWCPVIVRLEDSTPSR